MRLYGEVRHSHGPLFRWTAKRSKAKGLQWEWAVKVHTRDHFHDLTVLSSGTDLIAATREITSTVLAKLEE